MSQAYWLPAHVACATCGYVMEPIGRFQGGKVVVKCSGYACPEFGIEREYVGQLIDLQDVVAGDMDVPLERESAALEAAAVDVPVDAVPAAPPPNDPAPVVPDAVV